MVKTVAVLLLVTLPGTLLGVDVSNGAILLLSGSVQVNGSPVSRSFTVFPGDRIQTGADGSVLVKSRKAALKLGRYSAIVYKGSSIEIDHGYALLAVSNELNARISNLSVSAMPNSRARFALSSAKGVDTVTAIEGSVKVTDGTNVTHLDKGESLQKIASQTAGYQATGSSDDTERRCRKNDANVRELGPEEQSSRRRNCIPGWFYVAGLGVSMGSVLAAWCAADLICEEEEGEESIRPSGNPSPSKP